MLETTGARRFTQGPYPEQRLNACELYCFFMTFTIAYAGIKKRHNFYEAAAWYAERDAISR